MGGSNRRKEPFAPECNAPTHYTFQQENTGSKRCLDKKMPQTSFYGAEIRWVISNVCANSKKVFRVYLNPRPGSDYDCFRLFHHRFAPLWGEIRSGVSVGTDSRPRLCHHLQISHPESAAMTTPRSSSASPWNQVREISWGGVSPPRGGENKNTLAWT